MSEKIFVVGEYHEGDVTFSEMGKFPDVEQVSYQEIVNSSNIIASSVPILLCFPYSLWNNMVEKKDELYGVGKFGEYIQNLSDYMSEILEKRFPDAIYVNPPSAIMIERDKLEAKKKVSEQGIKVAQNLEKTIDVLKEELERGNSVYIKPRYGSMGKGITYLSQRKWTTNYKYDGRNINNHEKDDEWKEMEITGDEYFLKSILEENIVVERAVKNPLINNFKFDMRGRVIFGEAERRFGYGRTTELGSFTNISQRKITKSKIITLDKMEEFVPDEKINEALKIIENCTKILGLNYAGGDILFEGADYVPVFIEINSFPTPRMPEIFFPKVYKEIKNYLCDKK